jgi:hypothetical protein
MRQGWLVCAVLGMGMCMPRAAWPQGGNPVGPEFRANTYTTGYQDTASVAADPGGGFIVVWDGQRADDPNGGIFGQRFAGSGAPQGPEFRVNASTTDLEVTPSVSAGSGGFVVAWSSSGGYGGAPADVLGQRYAGDGTPQGPEFRVNTYTTGSQSLPAVAVGPSGGFVVAWTGEGPGDLSGGVFAQRFAATGAPLGPEFRVNTSTTELQFAPSVAADSVGNFVVAWSSGGYGGNPADVLGQRFASDGTPLGAEFRVNTYTTYGQYRPAVAADSAGNFVVVWDGSRADDTSGVSGQRFASSGAFLGPEFRVNTTTTDFQIIPSVAADAAGNFVVAWTTSQGYGGAPPDIFGQRFAGDGTPLGPEFGIATYTTNGQNRTAIAADPAGSFVVVWDSFGQDGDATGVFGQRYNAILPVELMHLRVE